MAEEVGTGYVRLLPSMRGFGRAAERQLRSEMRDPARKAGEEGGEEAAAGFGSAFGKNLRRRTGSDADDAGKKAGGRFAAGFGHALTAKSKGFGSKLMSALSKELEISGKTVATGFSTQFVGAVVSGLASGASKVAHGFAAVLALLPAAALAAGLAVGTLKLALSGMGDTLKAGLSGDTEKFKEGLKGLAPEARKVAREIVGMKDQFASLKNTVQANFFKPLVGQVKPLGEIYLRQLHLVLGDVARGFGQAGNQVSHFLRVPATFRAIYFAMRDAGTAVTNITRGVGSLVQAFLPLVTVGASFLPKLTNGFGSATARLASFMREAERTGKLRDFIQGGLDKLRELWETTKQIGRILENIGSIAQTAFSQVGGIFTGLGLQGGGVLDTFERLTDRAAKFVKTAKGSKTVTTVFETLRTAISGAMGFLQRIALLIGRVFGPILPQLSKLFEAVANLKTAFIDALEPALVSIGGVLGRNVVPALTKLANMLARNKPLLQGIGIAIATLLLPSTIAWAAATLAAVLPWLLLGAAIAGFAALVIIHFDTIKKVISGVFNWIKDHWKLLVTILTGPFAPLTAFIIAKWDTIKGLFRGLKDWIGRFVGGLWSPIFDALVKVVDKIAGQIRRVLDLLHLLPGQGGGTVNLSGYGGGYASFGAGRPTSGGKGGGNYRQMARGGIARARPGGHILNVAEAGEDEGIAPLSDLRAMVRAAVFDASQLAAMRWAPVGGATSGLVEVDVTNGTDDLIRVVRKWIRERTNGNVQTVLSGRR